MSWFNKKSYWYVVYTYNQGGIVGIGATTIISDFAELRIRKASDLLKENNNLQEVVISNWIKISKKQQKEFDEAFSETPKLKLIK